MFSLNKKIKKYVYALVLVMLTAFSFTSKADEGLKVSYSMYFTDAGWSEWAQDNSYLLKYGFYPNAFKASVQNQPQNMSGTVQYQVNLSGTGWMDWAENGAETGNASSNMPLEAVRVKLNGDLENNYDIYTKVLMEGKWTDWVKNGEAAGISGEGKHIDGVRIAVTAKDAGLPVDVQEPVPVSVRNIDPSKPMIALTFDDGPSHGLTDRVIAALDKVGGKGTFFMVGSRISGANEQTVKTMYANGHELGNHTFAHVAITKQSESQRADAMAATNNRIRALTGVSPKVFRPPYGAVNQAAKATIGAQGMSSVLWSVDTLDWKYKDTNRVVNYILSNVKDGDIVLMHDIHPTTIAAAEIVIPELVKRGYQLVTVSELASFRGGMAPGVSYGSFRR